MTTSTYYKGEITMSVPQVYSMCTISPSSLKRAQLVPQVLKLSCISLFTYCRCGIIYVADGIMA